MGLPLRSLVAAAGTWVPAPLLRRLLSLALGEGRVALCLHRVGPTRRPGALLPDLHIPPEELDALLAFLLSTRAPGERWLTVSFDDGYEDAARYVLTRAPRLPQVEWLVFVCPAKVEAQVGFRWDLAEWRQRAGQPVTLQEVMDAPLDVAAENGRPELRALAALPDYRLADVALCRQLQQLPNVTLGNHTNGHHLQTRLTPEEASAEYEASLRDFERLFGPQAHFAFPFGTPGVEFEARHVAALRTLGDFLVWSTQARPYAAEERVPGAVLPRFPVDGTLSWRQSALLIAAHALRSRLRGGAPLTPPPRAAPPGGPPPAHHVDASTA